MEQLRAPAEEAPGSARVKGSGVPDREVEAPTPPDSEPADPDPEIVFEPTVDPGPVAPKVGVHFCELSLETCRWPCWRDGAPPSIDGLRFCRAPPTSGSALMLRRRAACLSLPRRSPWSVGERWGPLFYFAVGSEKVALSSGSMRGRVRPTAASTRRRRGGALKSNAPL